MRRDRKYSQNNKGCVAPEIYRREPSQRWKGGQCTSFHSVANESWILIKYVFLFMFASVRLDGSKGNNFSTGGSKIRFGSQKHTRCWSLTTKVKGTAQLFGTHSAFEPHATGTQQYLLRPSAQTCRTTFINKGLPSWQHTPSDWAVQHNPRAKELHVILLFTAATVYSHSLITT